MGEVAAGPIAPSVFALGIQQAPDMRILEKIVGQWAVQTFGGPERITPCIIHLRREVEELAGAAADGNGAHLVEEAADCLILLMALAAHAEFSLTDAFKAKMLKNLRRTWRPPDHEGVVEHQRGGEEAASGGGAPAGEGG